MWALSDQQSFSLFIPPPSSIPRSDNSVWERRLCATSGDGQGSGTGSNHLDKTNCQLQSRSSCHSDNNQRDCGHQSAYAGDCGLFFPAPVIPQSLPFPFFRLPEHVTESFLLAYNYSAVIGQAAVIKSIAGTFPVSGKVTRFPGEGKRNREKWDCTDGRSRKGKCAKGRGVIIF